MSAPSTSTRSPTSTLDEFEAIVARSWVMLTGAGLGLLLWLLDVITLFRLEVLVTALFAVFWTVQTVEQSGDRD